MVVMCNAVKNIFPQGTGDTRNKNVPPELTIVNSETSRHSKSARQYKN